MFQIDILFKSCNSCENCCGINEMHIHEVWLWQLSKKIQIYMNVSSAKQKPSLTSVEELNIETETGKDAVRHLRNIAYRAGTAVRLNRAVQSFPNRIGDHQGRGSISSTNSKFGSSWFTTKKFADDDEQVFGGGRISTSFRRPHTAVNKLMCRIYT